MRIKNMQNYEVMYHKILAKNVKLIRKKNKLSQEAFAEKIGCSREFVSRVEHLREKLSLKMVLKISYLFKVDPSNLFTEEASRFNVLSLI